MTVENISWSISMKECLWPSGSWTCNLLITSRRRIQLCHWGRPMQEGLNLCTNFIYDQRHLLATCSSYLPQGPNKDSNQPVHPRSLISVFVICMKKLCIFGYPKCAKWRFWSDCANAQADQNLCWLHFSKGVSWLYGSYDYLFSVILYIIFSSRSHWHLGTSRIFLNYFRLWNMVLHYWLRLNA